MKDNFKNVFVFSFFESLPGRPLQKYSRPAAMPALHRPIQAASPSFYGHNITYDLGILKN
jgi:hypothetical protein